MSRKAKAPKGTFDILPADSRARERVEGAAAAVFARAGFGRIETPVFEDTELFHRSVGESTDIVQKEMFTFDDLGGRSITLRPEGTAAVCRAYVEHGMHKLPQPVKLWYSGPFFRYEAPQAGRYRQFHQIGAETIGSDDPLADAEQIMLLSDLLAELAVPGVKLHLASLGSTHARAEYRDDLQRYLREHEGEISGEVRSRIDANPLRAFDAKDEATRRVMEGAPKLIDRLAGEDLEHFGEVRGMLDTGGIDYEIDPTLVRGLDYYTRTVFAFTAEGLGAQSEIGGGGRYDGLVAELGGPETAAVGWAAGIERILLALGESAKAERSDVFIVAAEPAQRRAALALASELRHAGLVANLDLAGRSLKGQLKQADRSGARYTAILEGGGATLRDMGSGEQREVDVARLADELREGR